MRAWLVLMTFPLGCTCYPEDPNPGGGDSDVDSDVDGDSDADADSDSDSDSDTDTGRTGVCSDPADLWGAGTPGAGGHAEVILLSCPFGCPLDRPLATGMTESFAATADDLVTGFQSTDPAVLSIDADDDCPTDPDYARVTGVAPGDAEIVVLGPGGVELDRVPWNVHDGATFDVLALDESPLPPGPIVVTIGGADVIVLGEIHDADGTLLYASEGIHWTLPDTSVVAIGLDQDADVRYSIVNLRARAQGETTLHVEAAWFMDDLAVSVP